MLIVEFDRPPSWSLDASETGECNSFTLSRVHGVWLNFGTSTDQINEQSPPLEKKPVKLGKYDIHYVLLCNCECLQVNIDHKVDSMQFLSRVK